MAEYFDNNNLLKTAFKWRKHLLIITLSAIVLAVIFSSPWVIEPKYRSYAVLYPANIIPMGTETPTEQMLQVLQSDDIQDMVVRAFNLYDHYKIDTAKNKHYKTAMKLQLEDNVRIKKTEYESVVIEVLDTDPLVAKEMAESIITFFNKKERTLQRDKSMEVVKILKNELDKKIAEMDTMEAKARALRMKYGILDYELQTEYATERYLINISGSSSEQARAKEIEPLLDNLKDKGGEFLALNEHLWRIRGKYNDLKEEYETAVRDVEKELTYANVVTKPAVSDKKAYPIRWLIVVISAVSAFLFGCFVIGAIENYRTMSASNNK